MAIRKTIPTKAPHSVIENALDFMKTGHVPEDRMWQVLDNIEDTLSDGEVTDEEYGKVVFDTLKSNGIIFGDYEHNSEQSAEAEMGVDYLLQVERFTGLRQDYVALPGIPLSVEAEQDIDECDYLTRNLAADVLEEKLKIRNVPGKVVRILQESDICEGRRLYIAGYIAAQCAQKVREVERVERYTP